MPSCGGRRRGSFSLSLSCFFASHGRGFSLRTLVGKGGKKKTSSSSSPLDIEVVSAGLSTPQKRVNPLSSASAENGERIDTKRKQSLQLPRSALLGAIKQLMPHVKRYFRLQVWPEVGNYIRAAVACLAVCRLPPLRICAKCVR